MNMRIIINDDFPLNFFYFLEFFNGNAKCHQQNSDHLPNQASTVSNHSNSIFLVVCPKPIVHTTQLIYFSILFFLNYLLLIRKHSGSSREKNGLNLELKLESESEWNCFENDIKWRNQSIFL